MSKNLTIEQINSTTNIMKGILQPLIKDLIGDIKSPDPSDIFNKSIESKSLKELIEIEAALQSYESYIKTLVSSIRVSVNSNLNKFSDSDYTSEFNSEYFDDLKGTIVETIKYATKKDANPADYISDLTLLDKLYPRKLNSTYLKTELSKNNQEVINTLGTLITVIPGNDKDVTWKLK